MSFNDYSRRSNMKSKIQAQRKFAQGAPVPTPNISSERRLEVAHNREQRNVVRNNTHPKALLDFVAFNQIHGHKQPVVLLERLRTNQANTLINHNNEPMEVSSVNNSLTNGNSDDTMRLRSYNWIENTDSMLDGSENSDHYKALEVDFIMTEISPPKFTPKIKTNSSNVSDVSVDEDRPLVYFVDKKKLSNNKRTRKRGSVQKRRKNKITKKPCTQNQVNRMSGRKKNKNNITTKSMNSPENYTNTGNSTSTIETNKDTDDNENFLLTTDTNSIMRQVMQHFSDPSPVPEEAHEDSVDTLILDVVNDTPDYCVPYSEASDSLTLIYDEEHNEHINNSNLTFEEPRILLEEAECVVNPSNCAHGNPNNCTQEPENVEEEMDEEEDGSVDPWEDFHSMDLNILKKPTNHVLRVTLSSQKKVKGSKSIVICCLVTTNNSNHMLVGKENPISIFKRLRSNFNLLSKQIIRFETENESIKISPDGIVIKERGKANRAKGTSSTSNGNRTMSSPEVDSNETCINISDSDSDEPSRTTELPRKCLDAPVFTPNAQEFADPVAYFDSIMPIASKYGICKVVPPAGFTPSCCVNDEMTFNVINQYVPRLFTRWGPGSKELCTIKSHLASQGVVFKRSPLYEGMEVNLPKLYKIVQNHGGLKKVIERKRWGRVAEEMRFTKGPNPEKKLDQLYVKYLLPYAALSTRERGDIIANVERVWGKTHRKMMERANIPLYRQNRLLSDCETSEEEDSEDDDLITTALAEVEECVVTGRKMNLATFKKIAATAQDTFFTSNPSTSEVEREYWRIVLLGDDHLCVNCASIDTGTEGYGFTTNSEEPFAKHPWNLKRFTKNPRNVLQSLGSLVGVTVPTLHLGMVFSTSCWHRDPHGLPWVEYMHVGPPKIWYGIPPEQSSNFRKVVEMLCPTSYQNKSIWLPSDIVMVPPSMLREHNVSLARVEQLPGEYIIVFPKAYSCSISTGFTISESVYFASTHWLHSGLQFFLEAQFNCEPTMISIEALLQKMVMTPHIPLTVLQPALSVLNTVFHNEKTNRHTLEDVTDASRITYLKHEVDVWNVRDQDECMACGKPLYLSRVSGLTKNNTMLCLAHALVIVENKTAKNRPVPPFRMDYFYSQEEMDAILEHGKSRLLSL